MKCALLILSAVLAAPLYAIAIVDIDASWSVTEKATGNIICSGEHHGSEWLIDTLCPNAVPGLEGIHTQLNATASDNPTPSIEVFSDVFIGGIYDSDAFDVFFESFIFAEAITTAQITGGTGPGLIFWVATTPLGGGPSISGHTFTSVCEPVFDGCVALEPFTFGDIITVSASASLGIGPLHNAGVDFGGQGFAVIQGTLLDLNEIPIPGEFTAVPEPATWLLSLVAGVLIHIGRKRLG